MAEGPPDDQTAQSAAATGKMKVFISYSRRDLAFASDLKLALEDKGYDALVDHEEIDPNEKWKDRLGQLIFSCDTVVFVLSEHSAGSPICAWEVDEAARLDKRMLIVTPGAVPPGVKPPERLSDGQWISCWRNPDVPGSSFVRGVIDLDRALKTDLKWLRQQTRLSEQATIWLQRTGGYADHPVGHAMSSMLLRGNMLSEAIQWMRDVPAHARVPEHIARFIAVAEQGEARLKAEAETQLAEREKALKAAEKANRRAGVFAWLAIVVALVLSAAAAAGGYFAAQNYAASSASRSALFAREASTLFWEGDYTKSMLMSLEGDPAARAGAVENWFNGEGYLEARNAVARAMAKNSMLATFGPPTLSNAMLQDRGVVAIALHRDGERFLTGMSDGTVSLWQHGRAEPIETFAAHDLEVASIATSPTDDRFLTGSLGGAKLWQIGVAEPLATYPSVGGGTYAVAFHPDGKRFVTGDFGGDVVLWHTETGPLQFFSGHRQKVRSIAFHPDGERLLTASSDGTVKLWTIGDDVPLASFDADKNGAWSVAFHPDGERFLSAGADGTAKLWHLDQSAPLETFGGYDAVISAVAFLPDSSRFLTASWDTGSVRLWQIGSNQPLAAFNGHQGSTNSLAIDPLGHQFLTGSGDGTAKLWSLESDAPLSTFEGRSLYGLWLHPDGKRFLSGAHDGALELWQRGRDRPTITFSGHTQSVETVAFHPDGERFLAASHDGALKLWRMGQQSPSRTFPDQVQAVGALSFANDGERFLIGWEDGSAQLWEISGDKPSQVFTGHTSSINAVAYHPDGQHFLTGSSDGTAKLWRIGEGAALKTYFGSGDPVMSLAFFNDGERFLTGAKSGTAVLWQLAKTEPERTFVTDGLTVSAIAMVANESLFLAADSNGEATLFSVDDNEPLATFGGHQFPYAERDSSSMVTLADGKQFVTGAADGSVRDWQVPDFLLESAEAQVRRACEALQKIGVTDFSELDRQRFAILDRNAPHPCRHVWGFDPRKGETAAAR
jgi:WD40 repeat protein